MDYNARWYSPSLGRFTQPDTIIPDLTNPQALNRYSYVSNNPINFTDPTGHKMEGACGVGDTCTDDVESEPIPPGNIVDDLADDRDDISEDDRIDIALAVFAETDSGQFDEDILELHVWLFFNRHFHPNASIWTNGSLKFFRKLGYWSENGEMSSEIARTLCLQNPTACPMQSEHFQNVLDVVNSVYEQWISGVPDPTNGSFNFSHADSLERFGTVFEDHEQLRAQIDANNSFAASQDPNFVAGTSRVFDKYGWSPGLGYYNQGPAIVVFGNSPCIYDSTCGLGP